MVCPKSKKLIYKKQEVYPDRGKSERMEADLLECSNNRNAKKSLLLKKVGIIFGVLLLTIMMVACSSESDYNSNKATSESTNVSSTNGANSEDSDVNEGVEEAEVEYLGVLGQDILFGDLLLLDDVSGKEVTITGTYFTTTGDDRYLFLYREIVNGSINLVCDLKIRDLSSSEVFSIFKDYDHEDKVVIQTRVKLDEIELIESKSGGVSEMIYADATEFEILNPDSKEAEIARGDNYYYYVGDTLYFSTGLEFKILSTGWYTDIIGQKYVYMEAEIYNGGETDSGISAFELQFYGDDYYLTNGFPPDASAISGASIAPGRKTKGYFYAMCPNYDDVKNIEVQFDGVDRCTIVLKDEVDEANFSGDTETSAPEFIDTTSSYDIGVQYDENGARMIDEYLYAGVYTNIDEDTEISIDMHEGVARLDYNFGDGYNKPDDAFTIERDGEFSYKLYDKDGSYSGTISIESETFIVVQIYEFRDHFSCYAQYY